MRNLLFAMQQHNKHENMNMTRSFRFYFRNLKIADWVQQKLFNPF